MIHDPTHSNLDLALLDQKVACQFTGQRYAYVAVTSPEPSLGIAVEGEPGYTPVEGLTYDSYDAAASIADGMNLHIGLSVCDALMIVGSTMGGAS